MKIQHVRIARSTSYLDEVVAFYPDVLDLDVLSKFDDHDGFDGVMLGQRGDSMHFEFTRQHGAIVEDRPSPENLIVLYFDEAQWTDLESNIAATGTKLVPTNWRARLPRSMPRAACRGMLAVRLP